MIEDKVWEKNTFGAMAFLKVLDQIKIKIIKSTNKLLLLGRVELLRIYNNRNQEISSKLYNRTNKINQN